MADIFSAEKGSWVMSRIRSKWTGPEVIVHNFLKGNRVRHRMHPKIAGNPDAILTDFNVAVFVDGCFWHGCGSHCRIPKSNSEYWSAKIGRNMERDVESGEKCRAAGLEVMRIWECELQKGMDGIGRMSR